MKRKRRTYSTKAGRGRKIIKVRPQEQFYAIQKLFFHYKICCKSIAVMPINSKNRGNSTETCKLIPFPTQQTFTCLNLTIEALKT